MKLQEKYSGSTVLIILGVLFFILGVAGLSSGAEHTKHTGWLIIGLPLVFGALAYRSAKRRVFLVKNPSIIKIMLEVIYLSLAILPFVYMSLSIDGRTFREFSSQNPHIFLWIGVVIAYFSIIFFGKTSDVD